MIHIRLRGVEDLERKLQPEVLDQPVRNLFTRVSEAIRSNARDVTPVDTGRLRNSLGYEILGGIPPKGARVGTNVFYAPFVHEGTRPHYPPARALRTWARRHGFASPWPVVRAIGRRGTRSRPFLRQGVGAAAQSFDAYAHQFARDLEEAARRR